MHKKIRYKVNRTINIIETVEKERLNDRKY